MTNWIPNLIEGQALYLSIAEAIEVDIRSGRLAPGQKLPPHRDLAWRLKVTVGTVTRAYREAERRGLLSGHVGRGSFVRAAGHALPLERMENRVDTTIDLTHVMPPLAYTEKEFDEALTFFLRDPARVHLLDYAPPEGLPRWRQLGVRWLHNSGIDAVMDDVIVTPGALMGLDLCLRHLARPGEGLMAEALNFPHMRPLAERLGLRLAPLEMTEQGVDLISLERVARLGHARLLYLVPSYQNPTTTTLNEERRHAIVDLARRHDLIILEDDLFRLLDDRPLPPTFYSLAPERTYHITSLSKTLAPGLRMGFVACPPKQAKLLFHQQRLAGARMTALTAEIACHWIETDMASRVLQRVREEQGRRRQLFCDLFAEHRFLCSPGSPHAWLGLPENWTGTAFAAKALSLGVKISPAAAFRFGERVPDRYVRLCFGAPQSLEDMRRALSILHQLSGTSIEEEFATQA